MGAYPRHNAAGQRQHTNPKALLRGWEASEPPGLVWCYAKLRNSGRRISRQPLASATVLRNIWTEDDEHRSNTEVEQPAASGLKRLTEAFRPTLRSHERQALARYMMSLFRRGWQELAAQPQRLRAEVPRLEAMLHTSGFSSADLHALQDHIEELSSHPPGRPLPIREISDVMEAMRWTVLRCPAPVFVTGDSPVQILPHVLIDPESEVTLPLSPTRALICDWGFPRPSLAIRRATSAEVLEVNRRTALGAEQYIYFAAKPAENALGNLLDGSSCPRILDANRSRVVPGKHRRAMQRQARRILLGRERENENLVKSLRELAEGNALIVGDGDQSRGS